MTVGFGIVLVGLSLVGAFVSGLVGVGGAIVMIPLLLFGPPTLGVGQLDMKTVAAVTMVQVFVAALSAVAAHRRRGAVKRELAGVGGATMALGSLAGAFASHYATDRFLLLVFGCMTLVALGLMFAPIETVGQPVFAEHVTFSVWRAIAVCLIVGLMAGLVGAGGAFLLVPLLLVFVGIPIRVAIASSLAITVVAAAAGVAGKLMTGQVPVAPTVAVVLGAVPGAQLGAFASRKLTGKSLRRVLFVVILASAIRVWWGLLVPVRS